MDYYQLNQDVNPDPERLRKAYNELSPEEQKDLELARKTFLLDAKAAYNKRVSGLGPMGFRELLCKLALFKRSEEIGGPKWKQLARTKTVVEALKDY